MGAKRSRQFTSEGMKDDDKNKNAVHPVWRGVGILLMVLVPVMGYAGAMLFLDANNHNNWFKIPNQLYISAPDHLILVKAILTIIIGGVIYFLLMMLTFIIYRFFGPSRLGPTDAPPIHWKDEHKSS
jgi:quinol-cytochrome oxidoreductase complex cytochrome b subunit